MKSNIIKNEDRGTVTLALSPVFFFGADYLYKKYKKPTDDEKKAKYFASGVLAVDYKDDLLPVVKKLATALNETCSQDYLDGEEITINDLLSLGEDYAVFQENTDKNGEKDGNFKINLQNKAREKAFLFYDVDGTKPVDVEDSWKKIYAIEVEFSARLNKEGEKFVFAIFHRGIVIGERDGETNYKQNNSAFAGFTFEDSDDEVEVPF